MKAGRREKVFISHSIKDSFAAKDISTHLMAAGIDVWFTEWELLPGESLIQKLVVEGLTNGTAFLILISEHSVKAPWLWHELDHSVLSRIEKTTKLIPVLLDDVNVPVTLRSLHWVNLGIDFDSGLKMIKKQIEEI